MTRNSRRGFGKVEVAVCVVIIVTMIGLFLPAVRKVREPANRARCLSNIRQIMLAVQNYESNGIRPRVPLAGPSGDNAEKYMPTGCWGPGDVTEDRLSWMVGILPFVEGGNIYQQTDIEKRYSENRPAVDKRFPPYQCPAAPDSATNNMPVTTYMALSGIGLDAANRPAGSEGIGFMGYDRLTRFADIKDGQSLTIALIDTHTGLGPWARGGPSNVRGIDPNDQLIIGDKKQISGHKESAIVVLADCSTRSISQSINAKTLAAAITIAGNEILGSDW